jgi:hypothetical protein
MQQGMNIDHIVHLQVQKKEPHSPYPAPCQCNTEHHSVVRMPPARGILQQRQPDLRSPSLDSVKYR